MKVCALTTDLMDRSKLSSAIPGVVFALTDDAEVVIVDLARGTEQVATLRAQRPAVRIVCYGPHVDDEAMSVDADVVLPRSRFFRDIPAAVFGRS